MDHGLMLESAYFAILIISLIAYKSRIKSIKENNEKSLELNVFNKRTLIR